MSVDLDAWCFGFVWCPVCNGRTMHTHANTSNPRCQYHEHVKSEVELLENLFLEQGGAK